jgi:hypothetical protein
VSRRRIEVPSTIGGFSGAGFAAIVTATAEVVAKAHGFDLGPATDATLVFTMMGSGGAIGDHIQRRITVRRQLSRLRQRVRKLEDGRARLYLLERLRRCEADWRAGLLSDDGIREFVLDEVYARYVVPHDAARARTWAAVAEAKADERLI